MSKEGSLTPRMKSIADNIRILRESRNLTQDYLAMKLGLSQNAFSKIELGYTKITVERLYKIAELLETDIYTLLQPNKNTTGSSTHIKRETTL